MLLGVGAAITLGLGSRSRIASDDRLAVRIWQTEEAADHPVARERAAGYLRSALEQVGFEPAISFGEPPQDFTTSDRAIERTAWPTRVLVGASGAASIDPVADVNLLLTDGDVARSTAGFAYPHIATVPGARFLAAVDPVEATAGVVEYTIPGAVAHLLLHEVGHALGLEHNHGAVVVEETTVTVSPMVSGYAWADGTERPRDLTGGECNAGLPSGDGRRQLAMTYSTCAKDALRTYRRSDL